MFNKRLSLITFFLYLSFSIIITGVTAQSIFTAGVFAGPNLSQINRDGFAGYHKIGINGGLKVITRLTPIIDLHTELAYSQKGSFTNHYIFDADQPHRSIAVDYIEIPVLFSIKDWLEEKNNTEYHIAHLLAGASIGRLMRKESKGFGTDSNGLSLEEHFSNTDISLIGGATFFLNPNLGIHARFSYGITPLTTEDLSDEYKDLLGKLNTYLVTLRILYLIR